jgi:PPIC-type PPIASE domain
VKRKILILVLITTVLGGAAIFWRVLDSKTKAAKLESAILKNLSAEEIALILKNQSLSDPERVDTITKSEESRRAFLRGMKEYFALAAKARREGMADDKNFAPNIKLKENGLLSELYPGWLIEQGRESLAVTKEQIEEVWKNPDNEKEFNEQIDALYAVQNAVAANMESSLGVTQRLQGEGLEKARKGWARAKILSGLARADAAFMELPVVKLRLKILESGVLSNSYLAKYWRTRIKATEPEIADYLAKHPEYDQNKKLDQARLILARARRGEDFAKLAKEFSEDRATKNLGGLYKDWAKGAGLWAEVETAALKAKKGEVVGELVETKDGYHIVQLINQKTVKESDGTETVKFSLRHILLQKRFEDPLAARLNSQVPAPFKTGEEIAKTEIEVEKRKSFIEEVIGSENISLPEDFQL